MINFAMINRRPHQVAFFLLLAIAGCATNHPIEQAALDGQTEVVKTLAAQTETKPYLDRALSLAASTGRLDIVEILLERGANPNSLTRKSISRERAPALFGAAANGVNVKIIESLFNHGANVNLADSAGNTPIYAASYNGHTETVNVLLKHGADANLATKAGITPIYMASQLGHAEVVNTLLEHGVDANRLVKGYPPLMVACQLGHAEAAKALADHGANVNWTDPLTGHSIIYQSALSGQTAAIKVLLEHGADVDAAIARMERFFTQNAAIANCSNCAEVNGQLKGAETLLTRASRNFEVAATARNSGGISKSDLKDIVQAAVQGASSAQAKPAAEAKAAIESDIDKAGYSMPEHPHDFALVVGIDSYSDLPAAQFAERDAEAVKNHFLAMGIPSRNVVLLSGDKAGYKSIEKFVETWLPRMVDESSRVFFYFSGHGAPDVKTGMTYLVPWDGDANFLENTGYPLKRLYEKLGALNAAEVVVVLDACFSGAGGRSVMAKGARPLMTKVDNAAVPLKLTVFAAASTDQITSTLEDQGHGTFTYYFLKGLSGGAKDASGRVTTEALYRYLKPKVQDAARRQNRDQEPVLRESSDTELVRF